MIPRDLGLRVCQALGIDPGITKSVSITFNAREAAVVTVVQFIDDKRGNELNEILKHYTLRPLDD
jgi:hypothetical protein